MRFIRKPFDRLPASLIMDLAHPPCGWSSRDTAASLEERLCMLPGAVVEGRVLCEAHAADLVKARAKRARPSAA